MSPKLLYAMWVWTVRSVCGAIMMAPRAEADRRFFMDHMNSLTPQTEEYENCDHEPARTLVLKGKERRVDG